jgi:hypothetical protein
MSEDYRKLSKDETLDYLVNKTDEEKSFISQYIDANGVEKDYTIGELEYALQQQRRREELRTKSGDLLERFEKAESLDEQEAILRDAGLVKDTRRVAEGRKVPVSKGSTTQAQSRERLKNSTVVEHQIHTDQIKYKPLPDPAPAPVGERGRNEGLIQGAKKSRTLGKEIRGEQI